MVDADLVASHDIDMIQTCHLFFHPGHTGYPRPLPSGVEGMLSLLAVSSGGCFCPACEMPEYYQWLKFRCDSVTEVFGEIYRAIKDQKPEVEFRYNGSAHAQHMRMGVNFRSAHRLVSAS